MKDDFLMDKIARYEAGCATELMNYIDNLCFTFNAYEGGKAMTPFFIVSHKPLSRLEG